MDKLKTDSHILKLSLIQSYYSVLIDGLLYPIETLRNKIINNNQEHLNLRKGFVKYYRIEGIRSFFSGFLVVLPSNIVSNISWIYSYEQLNRIQYKFINKTIKNEKNQKRMKNLTPMFSSGIAELISNLLYLPLDIIKVRMQVQSHENKHYRTITGAIKYIYNKEGFKRFFSVGYLSLSLSIIKTSTFFLFYENMRKYVLKNKNKNSLSIFQNFYVSTITNLFHSILFNPAEVVLVRYQTLDGSKKTLKAKSIFLDIVKKEKFFALYKGFFLRVFIQSFSNILYFQAYEYYRVRYGFNL